MARIRNKEIGFVFQTFSLLARATALHNVELPPNLQRHRAGGTHRARQDGAEGDRSGGSHDAQAQRTLRRQRQRVAIAGAWSTILPSFLRTSPPDSHTGAEIMALFDRLNREGNAIVLVTHEHDIAEYAHRVIHLKDRQVAGDVRKK